MEVNSGAYYRFWDFLNSFPLISRPVLFANYDYVNIHFYVQPQGISGEYVSAGNTEVPQAVVV